MRLRFIKASPCHNTTVFITESVPPSEYVRIARTAMSGDCLAAEQVGFLVPPRTAAAARLEMSGGEFCGNATMALAALAVCRGRQTPGKPFLVEVSGAKRALAVSAKPSGAEGHYRASVTMPPLPTNAVKPVLPERIALKRPQGNVFLPGIYMTIVDDWDLPHAEFDSIMSDMKAWTVGQAGCVAAYQHLGGQRYRIKPYVDVRAVGSRMYEQACGSGSWALALWLASQDKRRKRFVIEQPCGEAIEVSLGKDGAATLSTDVYFSCEGVINI